VNPCTQHQMQPGAPSKKWSIHWASLLAMFNHYAAAWINNCLNRTSAIKVATMKFMDNFCNYKRGHHVPPPNRRFSVSKDEWDIKENTGKSMKNALYVLQYAKRYLLSWNDAEQWKNQVCSIIHCQVMIVENFKIIEAFPGPPCWLLKAVTVWLSW